MTMPPRRRPETGLLPRSKSAQSRPRPEQAAGGRSTVDQMSESSFPASDPPAVWTWEVSRTPDRVRTGTDSLGRPGNAKVDP